MPRRKAKPAPKPAPKPVQESEYATAKDLICDLIADAESNDVIIEEVMEVFPDSAVDDKHCTKYRRELYLAGEIEADLAPRGSKDHKNWAKENMNAAKKGPFGDFWTEWEEKQSAKVASKRNGESDEDEAPPRVRRSRKGKAVASPRGRRSKKIEEIEEIDDISPPKRRSSGATRRGRART